MTDLLTYLPEFWHEISEMKAIQDSISPLLEIQKADINDFLSQCFISTATTGLKNWENEFGIQTITSLNYDERRSKLYSKLMGCSTSTIHNVQNLFNNISNTTCHIAEDNSKYIIKIIVCDFPDNLSNILNYLQEIIPAHLKLIIECKNKTWNDVKSKKWNYYMYLFWFGKD